MLLVSHCQAHRGITPRKTSLDNHRSRAYTIAQTLPAATMATEVWEFTLLRMLRVLTPGCSVS